MTNSYRNADRRYIDIKVTGTALLIILVSCLFFLLSLIIPFRTLLWILGGLVILFFIVLAVGAIIPFHPDEIILKQGNEVMSDLDRKLLGMALSDDISQTELDDFLKGWDIEASPIKTVMLVAYLMKTRPALNFPAAVTPRLNGVLSFCRFQNLKREAHFSKVGETLRKEGIPFAILKGGAMKVYRPDFPRWMNDIDMIVPSDKYERAVDVVMSMGYDKPMATDHSVDLHLPGSDEGLIDIHKHLEMFTGNEDSLNDRLFARAEERDIFSTIGYLPGREDMVFISLVNFYKNISKNQTRESSLTTFYDIKYLLAGKADFDYSIIKENARITGGEFQVLYASKLIDAVVPGLIPESFVDSIKLSNKEFKRQFIDFLFRRDVLSNARDMVKETKVGASLQKDWNPFVFIWVALVEGIKICFASPLLKYPAWRMYTVISNNNKLS